jgi:hypothetical protein
MSIAELGGKLPSAGGLYTYVAAGLGAGPGFLLAWLLIAAYLLIDGGLIVLLLGLIAQENLTSQLNTAGWLWAPIVVFCICVATALVVLGIKPSTKVQVVMGIFEMLVLHRALDPPYCPRRARQHDLGLLSHDRERERVGLDLRRDDLRRAGVRRLRERGVPRGRGEGASAWRCHGRSPAR